MTVAPHDIDPARFLEEHLAQASPDLLRQMLATFINTLLSADADQVCGASYGGGREVHRLLTRLTTSPLHRSRSHRS